MSVVLQEKDMRFTFHDGWEAEPFDTWPEYRRLTDPPFVAKGCDFVVHVGRGLWLVEAKDYTYEGVEPPSDLAATVGVKVFHTLATLHAVARWGDGERRDFATRAIACADMTVCLTVEIPDKGRKLIGVEKVLSDLLPPLKKVTKLLGCHRPVVTTSFMTSDPRFSRLYPWTARRDPDSRHRHRDR